jgi:hypothetical protein
MAGKGWDRKYSDGCGAVWKERERPSGMRVFGNGVEVMERPAMDRVVSERWGKGRPVEGADSFGAKGTGLAGDATDGMGK